MATWLAEFLDKLGTWSNQAWASLEPIMPNVAKIPKDFLEATQQTLYMTFWTALWSGIFGILLGVVLVVTHDGGILENRWFYRILDQLVNIFRSIPFIILRPLRSQSWGCGSRSSHGDQPMGHYFPRVSQRRFARYRPRVSPHLNQCDWFNRHGRCCRWWWSREPSYLSWL